MTIMLSPSSGQAWSSAGGRPGGAAGGTDTQLYVITTHKVRDRDGEPPFGWVPYGVEHAWRPGTRRTLCGEWTSGWTVFWDRAFSVRPGQAHRSCQGCVEASLPAASRSRLDPPMRRPA